MFARVMLCLSILLPGVSAAEPGTLCSRGSFSQVQCIRPSHFVYDTCQAIEIFAKDHGLPPGYFARLIWQESRFDPNALSHANARGIAQFIPATAERRGLIDPYNPADALAHSAEYLGELTRRYGNPGLAAVAYNGGERRADGLVAKVGGLARETIDYVQIITGLTAETWRDAPPKSHDFRLQKEKSFAQACHELARNRRISPLQPPEPDIRKWGVQMAFGTTKAKAMAQFKARARSCSGLVKGEKPDLIWQKSRASPRGGYFMVRIGRNDRDTAWRYCGQLKRKGCICAVYRNR